MGWLISLFLLPLLVVGNVPPPIVELPRLKHVVIQTDKGDVVEELKWQHDGNGTTTIVSFKNTTGRTITINGITLTSK